MKSITPSVSFRTWAKEISAQYKRSQIKAAIRVNGEMLRFYFSLGKSISETSFKAAYGSHFFDSLSGELKKDLPNAGGFSPINLRYMERFYLLYKTAVQIVPQLVEQLFSIPWGHHRLIIDKCDGDYKKAMFFVAEVQENNWSRDTLSNFLGTNLYERDGKAVTNFKNELPKENGDLAQQITKDPYNFDFLTMKEDYDEKELKEQLIKNIQSFLLELGTGFAFVGKESRLLVGETEMFSDLLFYNIKLHAYIVIEVKTGPFKPEHLGQLGTYVSAVNHLLKGKNDSPTIGLLVCKNKDNVLAKYSLENYNIPLGVSEFELSNLIPQKFKSSIPTIAEIEKGLKN